MITGLAMWLGGKLLAPGGIVPKSGILIVAGVLAAVGLMIGALGALAFVNHGLRSDLRDEQSTSAQCAVSLGVSQDNVGALEEHVRLQNEAVQGFADRCRAADQKGTVDALQVLAPPAQPRRFAEGAEGMNEWLAIK